MASHGGESGGCQETVLRLQGELFGHAPVYEGRHQHGAAGAAHAAEVLHAFSPGAPAEQADEDGTL